MISDSECVTPLRIGYCQRGSSQASELLSDPPWCRLKCVVEPQAGAVPKQLFRGEEDSSKSGTCAQTQICPVGTALALLGCDLLFGPDWMLLAPN